MALLSQQEFAARQLSIDFTFTEKESAAPDQAPELDLLSLLELNGQGTEALVIDKVLPETEPLEAPKKVLTAFDWRELREIEAMPKEAEAVQDVKKGVGFRPDDYPDRGTNYFTWKDEHIVRLHEALLEHFVCMFSKQYPAKQEHKLEALEWIFGEPKVHSYRTEIVHGRKVQKAVLMRDIPFTFECCCHLTGTDPSTIQHAIELALKANGESHLLEKI